MTRQTTQPLVHQSLSASSRSARDVARLIAEEGDLPSETRVGPTKGRGGGRRQRAIRIGVGGIHIESSTFSPYVSSASDFRVRSGETLLSDAPWYGAGWTADVEWVPTLHARALPGGIVERATYDAFKAQIIDGITNGQPLDGFLIEFHGAMAVEGMEDADGDLAASIRAALKPGALIAASMDLHGNVSEHLFGAVDILTAYRTAPHIDEEETRCRAARNLIEAIREPAPLYRALVHVPMLLPGEMTSTAVSPGREVYAHVAEVATWPDVIDAAMWMGFPWADEARCTAAVVTTAHTAAAARRAAESAASILWDARQDFRFVGPTAPLEECLSSAYASDARPYFISDTGDNPGAGGADDVTFALAHLVAAGPPPRGVLVASIHDEAAAAQAHALGVGTSADFTIGGHHDTTASPVTTSAIVRRLAQDPDGGPVALLEVLPGLSVIVTSKRKQYRLAEDYELLGVPLEEQDVIIVKIGYLEPELAAASKGWMMALTPGAVDQHLSRLPYRQLSRPIFPLDDISWSPEVRCLP